MCKSQCISFSQVPEMLRAMLTSVLTIPLYINNNQHWLFKKEESVVRNCARVCVCVCACVHVREQTL